MDKKSLFLQALANAAGGKGKPSKKPAQKSSKKKGK